MCVFPVKQFSDVFKQPHTAYTLVSVVTVGEMLSDISESHSSEHSVHKCVYRNICVTVSEKPQIILIRHLHTAEYQLSALYKPVYVISVTYTKFRRACFPDNIFRHCYILFRGQLYIVITALNDKRLYPIQFHYRCVISYPCVIHIELFRRRKIVGFSANHNVLLSGVAVTTPSSHTFTVSLALTAASAAPC